MNWWDGLSMSRWPGIVTQRNRGERPSRSDSSICDMWVTFGLLWLYRHHADETVLSSFQSQVLFVESVASSESWLTSIACRARRLQLYGGS